MKRLDRTMHQCMQHNPVYKGCVDIWHSLDPEMDPRTGCTPLYKGFVGMLRGIDRETYQRRRSTPLHQCYVDMS